MTGVAIEKLAPEMFETAARWLSKPGINRWLSGEWRHKDASPSLVAITVRNRKNELYLVRFEKEPCGLVGLSEIDLADGIAMVWYLLGEDRFASRGIISEAVRQAAKTAFSTLGLKSLHAWIMEDNLASRRVLEKSGFLECGRFRQAVCSGGVQVSRIYFDLIAPRASQQAPANSGLDSCMISRQQSAQAVGN